MPGLASRSPIPPTLAILFNTTIVSVTLMTVTLSAKRVRHERRHHRVCRRTARSRNRDLAWRQVLLWQTAIYNATYADSTLTGAGVKVANYTNYVGARRHSRRSIAGTVDYNNAHIYPLPSYYQPTAYVNESMVTALVPSTAPVVREALCDY